MSKQPIKDRNFWRSEIIGVLFIAASAVVISSLLGFSMGFLGIFLEKILRYGLGRGAFLLALMLFAIGVRYIGQHGIKIYTARFIALLLLPFNLLIIFHHVVAPENSELLPEYLTAGGGLFSGMALFVSRKVLGLDGSLILFAVTALCLSLFTFAWSLRSAFIKVGEKSEQGADSAASMVADVGRKIKKSSFFNYERILGSSQQRPTEQKKPPEISVQDKYLEQPPIINLQIDEQDFLPEIIAAKEKSKKTTDKKSSLDFSPADVIVTPGGYRYPHLGLLNKPAIKNNEHDNAEVAEQARILEQTLADFKVNAKIVNVAHGPAVTRFEIEPAPGVKVNRIVSLVDDLTLKLAAPGIRIETSIPGKSAMGIEVPKKNVAPVSFYDVIASKEFAAEESKITVALGNDIAGQAVVAQIGKMPHLLVAGSTGSGKSVCINTIINSLLFKASPDEVKFIMVDPKVVELSSYNGIPHLLTPVVTNAKKAASALFWAVEEMERRYTLFAETGVRDLGRYNNLAQEKLPYIIIIIDELADLMMVAPADVEDAICRLAQKARAAGLHLILATQRPSVDVITGTIKANIPSRIAFAVSSQIDSRTILDMGGAEKLLGKGDMLYYPTGMSKPQRVQGAFISDDEIEKITAYIKQQAIPIEYTNSVTEHELPSERQKSNKNSSESPTVEHDELLPEALEIIMQTGQASASLLQRRLRIGYSRAGRLVDTMEIMGIIGPPTGTSKPREILLSYDEANKRILDCSENT